MAKNEHILVKVAQSFIISFYICADTKLETLDGAVPQHEINQGDSYEVRTQELLLTHMSTHSFWAFERIELTEESWFKYTAINIMNEDQIYFSNKDLNWEW